jgi:hypothetical protein
MGNIDIKLYGPYIYQIESSTERKKLLGLLWSLSSD